MEYRLTLAGTVPVDEVAAREFPHAADRPTPDADEQGFAIDLHDRHGFTADIIADTDCNDSAPAHEGDDFELWEWEPAAAVDLTFTMTDGGDRFDAALRTAITAIARVLASGTEDAAVMLSGDTILLTRVDGVVTKHDRAWWEHRPCANNLIPG